MPELKEFDVDLMEKRAHRFEDVQTLKKRSRKFDEEVAPVLVLVSFYLNEIICTARIRTAEPLNFITNNFSTGLLRGLEYQTYLDFEWYGSVQILNG